MTSLAARCSSPLAPARRLFETTTHTLALALALALTLGGAARADTLEKRLPEADFGHLAQGDTDCPRMGCGAAAAVNSFVYLQKTYPGTYAAHPLIRMAGSTPTKDELIAAANLLAGKMHIQDPSDGAVIEMFILGQLDYFAEVGAGPTSLKVQLQKKWDSERTKQDPGDAGRPKPSADVQDETSPTVPFIFGELSHGEDVEILIEDTERKTGHYLTVTGITFDTVAQKGAFYVIDPDNPDKPTTIPIERIEDGTIKISYEYGESLLTDVTAVVAESPIPEPGTAALLLGGLACLLLRRRPQGAPR